MDVYVALVEEFDELLDIEVVKEFEGVAVVFGGVLVRVQVVLDLLVEVLQTVHDE